MSCKRTTTTRLLTVMILLASSLAIHFPIASARHVAVLKANNDPNIRLDMKPAKDSSMPTNDSSTKRGLEGRQLDAVNGDKTEAMGVKESGEKGKATISPLEKMKDSQQEVLQPAPPAQVGFSHRSQPSNRFRPRHHRADAATEMLNMLNRDYTEKAHRRRPINNDVPFHEEEP